MLMQGKKGLIMGVANDKSIAWGIAKSLSENGASIALNYQGDTLKKRVAPLAETINSDILIPCDVADSNSMKNVFETLGNRRYEWKCNNLNESSKRAALRLGFKFEGVFRQMFVFKGRNRDSAWFSIIDKENSKEIFEIKLANNLWLEENDDLPGNNQLGSKTSNFFGEILYNPNDFINFKYDAAVKNNLQDKNYEKYLNMLGD